MIDSIRFQFRRGRSPRLESHLELVWPSVVRHLMLSKCLEIDLIEALSNDHFETTFVRSDPF